MGKPGAGSHLVQCPPPGDRPPVLRAEHAARGRSLRGPRARKGSWSERASVLWPSHRSPSQGHRVKTTLTTQGHRAGTTLTLSGHRAKTASTQGHRMTSTPQGHTTTSTHQGHRTTLTAHPCHLQGHTALKTYLTLRPHNYVLFWRSRPASVKTSTRSLIQLRLTVIRSKERKTSWIDV